jgi:4-amino-4-deoxy-L-arabinose transferase-like glycosyltransferase
MNARDLRRCLGGLLVLVLLSVAFRNGGSRPLDGHEIFVAETATEMLASGEYLVPEFGGEPRLQKPPLGYWLAAAAQTVLRSGSPIVGEIAARLPSIVAGLALVALTYAIGRSAFECRRTGLLAAGILSSSWLFFVYSRSARPEMLYACFCALQLLGTLLALARARRGLPTARAALVAAAGLAGALLAKGPHLPLCFLVGAGLAVHLRAPELKPTKVAAWLVAGFLPALLYFGVVALRVEDALSVWTREMVQDKSIPLLLRPLRFYFPIALAKGMLPWVPLGLLAVYAGWRRRDHPAAAVLGTTVLASLFVLGFSGKLRAHYVLPLLPLVAVLGAQGFVSWWDAARSDLRARRWLDGLVVLQGVCVLAFLVGVAFVTARPHPGSANFMLWPALIWLGLAGALLLLSGVLLRARVGAGVGAAAAAVLIGWIAVANVGGDASRRWTHARQFARDVARAVEPGSEVLLDDGERSPLVYYGRLRTIRYPLDSPESWSRRPTPALVVSRARRVERLGLPAELVIAEAEEARDEMVLVRLAATPGSREEAPQHRAHRP